MILPDRYDSTLSVLEVATEAQKLPSLLFPCVCSRLSPTSLIVELLS